MLSFLYLITKWLFCRATRSFHLRRALRNFRNTSGTFFPIHEIQKRFAKDGTGETPPLIIETHWQKRLGYIESGNEFFMDAHYMFILWETTGQNAPEEIGGGNYPLACIAFEPQGRNGVTIRQIQGKYGAISLMKSQTLKKLKWERMLVQVVIEWARKAGLKHIHILPATQNDYYSCDNPERAKTFHLRYDVTARRMGLKFNARDRLYSARIANLKAV